MTSDLNVAFMYGSVVTQIPSAKDQFVCVLPHPDNVVAIDFEASSLSGIGVDVPAHEMSYPIEAGLSYPNGRTESFFIKPAQGWTDWSDDAEDYIHHISRDTLQAQGRDIRAVAEWLNENLAGKIVINDGPSAKADNYWCARLFEAAGLECQFKIVNVFEILDKRSEYYCDACTELNYSPLHAAHRAGADAENLMEIYKACYRYYAQSLGGRGVSDVLAPAA